ncbi:MAG: hypothetical protein OXR84_02365 [Magnetovibrio sp.]|nr:hypothetical protein [Magnetovibrio sp.]
MMEDRRATLDEALRFAEFLIEEHGLERALRTAREAAAMTHGGGDPDDMWPRIERILQSRHDGR